VLLKFLQKNKKNTEIYNSKGIILQFFNATMSFDAKYDNL